VPDDRATEPGDCTRLAPSPTGALHLGNARTFVVNWALARREGWRIVLRIEDLDGPRVKPGAEGEALDLLAWLGLDWDEGPVRQSDDLDPYRAAMERLAGRGVVYPSAHTRGDLAASAPQEGVSESRFPPELRPDLCARVFGDPRVNWRFVTPGGMVRFDDAFAGAQSWTPAETVGDFVVWTRRGEPAYQLAVVVDDARQGVTQIVRGDDLLDSTARQILLWRELGLGELPEYTHLPLVRGADGRRLAKRHGDTRLATYRGGGVPAEAVVGLLASWSGIVPRPEPMSAAEFRERFDLRRMSHESVTYGEEDDRWLRSHAR